MHVLIDATCISDQTFGTSQYALCLLKSLSELDEDAHYSVMIKRDLGANHPVFNLSERKNFRFIRTPIRIGAPQQQFKLFLPRNRIQADVFHCLTYNLPLMLNRYRSICTIHDLKFIVHPEYMHSLPYLKRWYFYQVTRAACRRSVKIIAISEATRRDLIRYVAADEKKIRVIGEASTLNVPEIAGKEEQETLLRTLGIRGRFFLILGCRRPHKNIENALKGFAHFLRQRTAKDWQVVITGNTRDYATGIPISEGLQELLRDRILITGYLPEKELDTLYRNAHALLYPSLFEGFGLPILEAMERGAPVITSDRSSMPEVAGDAALLVDPTDFKSIAAAMDKLLDEKVWNEHREKGYRRSAEFSWRKTARETISVYRAAAFHY